MANQRLKIGDVVKLRSGGPWLTVSEVNGHNITVEWTGDFGTKQIGGVQAGDASESPAVVSATCIHADADAALHPECAGCMALRPLPRWEVATDDRLQPHAIAATPLDEPAARQLMINTERERIARAMAEPLDAAVLAAIARGVLREQLWIEVDAGSSGRNGRRLMQGALGQATPVAQRRVLARAWIEHGAEALQLHSWSAPVLDGRAVAGNGEWCPGCPAARCGWDATRSVWVCEKCSRAWLNEHDATGRLLTKQPSLLVVRELTPEERAAHDEDPWPGVWAGEFGADLRSLTQDETDRLIRMELLTRAPSDERDEVRRVTGAPRAMDFGNAPQGVRTPMIKFGHVQRGGIDSDPMVRLLAYRAWGDRDRRWFDPRPLDCATPVPRLSSERTETTESMHEAARSRLYRDDE